MQSTAAYGALAATGLLNARPAGAATTWVAPANIPNDGSANASQDAHLLAGGNRPAG